MLRQAMDNNGDESICQATTFKIPRNNLCAAL